jgi:hypothetical protein
VEKNETTIEIIIELSYNNSRIINGGAII